MCSTVEHRFAHSKILITTLYLHALGNTHTYTYVQTLKAASSMLGTLRLPFETQSYCTMTTPTLAPALARCAGS